MGQVGKCAARTRTRAQRDSAGSVLSSAASPLHGRDHLLCLRARGGIGGTFVAPLTRWALFHVGNSFLGPLAKRAHDGSQRHARL
jgi:hypothetical protein